MKTDVKREGRKKALSYRKEKREMAYNIIIYKFAKRKNSTKGVPNNVTNKQFVCEVIDDTPITAPVVIIDSAGENISGFNYAYIDAFDRYYFISNWNYERGLWKASLDVDVLASFRAEIYATTAYVLRAASNSDPMLPDRLFPAHVGATYAYTQVANPFGAKFNEGSFIVGIINNDSNSYGAVSYYVMSSADFRGFSNVLLSNINIYGVQDVSNELLKCLYNPFQYIVSCIWLPFTPPLGERIAQVPVGWWNINSPANRLAALTMNSGTLAMDIPINPEASVRPWMKSSPYTDYYILIPPAGAFSISSDALVNSDKLYIAWNIDCITGDSLISFASGNANKIFNQVSCNIGIPVQIAQMAPNVYGQLQSATGIGSGGGIIDSFMNTLGNIGNALIAKMSPMQTTGKTGSFMAGYLPISLIGEFHGIAEENVEEFGRPCCKTLELSTLNGYIQCAHTEFKSNRATLGEIDAINAFFLGGFYKEA